MKNSKIRIISICAAIAVMTAMLAGCADHSKPSGTKDPVSTKPAATTTANEDTTDETEAVTTEDIPKAVDENGIATAGDTAYFTIPSLSPMGLSHYAQIMQENFGKYRSIKKIAVDGAVMNVQFKNEGTTFEGNPDIRIFITSVSALGYEKVFDKPEHMYGNLSIGLFKTDDAFIFERSTYGAGIKLIFTQYGIEEMDDSLDTLGDFEEEYNHPIISFTHRDDGKIGYTRQPYKYIAIQDASGLFSGCVSRDELFKEEGYVSFNEGKIEYHAEIKQTVSEACEDIDSSFDRLRPYGYDNFKTLDQFLEYNSQRYEEFK